ncbi:MAG: hypothetical protein WCA77_08435, partial [Thermoplasmata archaeon]
SSRDPAFVERVRPMAWPHWVLEGTRTPSWPFPANTVDQGERRTRPASGPALRETTISGQSAN